MKKRIESTEEGEIGEEKIVEKDLSFENWNNLNIGHEDRGLFELLQLKKKENGRLNDIF